MSFQSTHRLVLLIKHLSYYIKFCFRLTGICQRRHIELLVAIMQAKEMGLITFDLPFQKYDYSEYVGRN